MCAPCYDRVGMARAPSPRAPRKRRTAEEARDAILDAAERRLVEGGPVGIRLKDVADDVGVSHPTVLHHFGTREALVHAVAERAFSSIHADVVAAISGGPAGEEHASAMVERVFTALSGGRGRVFTWLALSDFVPPPDDRGLARVADASHALRTSLRGAKTPPREDTVFAIILATLVLVAETTTWPMVATSVGLGRDPKAEGRFRVWFARLLSAHLREGG